jgi:hypothetical protein
MTWLKRAPGIRHLRYWWAIRQLNHAWLSCATRATWGDDVQDAPWLRDIWEGNA